MIITIGQLRLIHYFYFSMGIFGLTNAFFFGFESAFSLIFLSFYIINSAVSWYMAYVARKRMADYVVVQSAGFFLRHVLITVLTVVLTTLIWVSEVIPDVGLLNALLMANYFVLFLAGLWYAFTRADFIGGLFTIYDSIIFKRSKDFILGIKNKHKGFFGREIVTDMDISEYKYGTIEDVDDNLISAWKHKSKLQYVLECLGRIEISIARHALEELKEKMFFLQVSPENHDKAVLIKKAVKYKEAEISMYEESFFEKTGESEFL